MPWDERVLNKEETRGNVRIVRYDACSTPDKRKTMAPNNYYTFHSRPDFIESSYLLVSNVEAFFYLYDIVFTVVPGTQYMVPRYASYYRVVMQ